MILLRPREQFKHSRSRGVRPGIEALEGRIVPSFLAATSFDAGSHPGAVAVGDFNSDGIPDLAVAHYEHGNTLSIFHGVGDGTFKFAADYQVGLYPTSIIVADLNGDGISDLAVADESDGFGHGGGVSILLGNGDGTFQPATTYPAGFEPFTVATADFNGDGIADLAVTDVGTGTVNLLFGNGDGSFQKPQGFFVGNRPWAVATGDFNGDGIPDLAVTHYVSDSVPGQVSVFLGNGDGTFQNPIDYQVGTHPVAIAAHDFNSDGVADLVVVNGFSDSISILLGNGDGTFQPAQAVAVGREPGSVAIDDFNGDGIPDLATANYQGNSISVMLGNGDGSFQTAVDYDVGSMAMSVASGDFNGDGFPDLVVSNYGSNTVSVLLNAADWGGGAPWPKPRIWLGDGNDSPHWQQTDLLVHCTCEEALTSDTVRTENAWTRPICSTLVPRTPSWWAPPASKVRHASSSRTMTIWNDPDLHLF